MEHLLRGPAKLGHAPLDSDKLHLGRRCGAAAPPVIAALGAQRVLGTTRRHARCAAERPSQCSCAHCCAEVARSATPRAPSMGEWGRPSCVLRRARLERGGLKRTPATSATTLNATARATYVCSCAVDEVASVQAAQGPFGTRERAEAANVPGRPRTCGSHPTSASSRCCCPRHRLRTARTAFRWRQPPPRPSYRRCRGAYRQ